MKFFQSLGRKSNNHDTSESALEEANEALRLFKDRNSILAGEASQSDDAIATTARFFKPVSRYELDGTFVEVDEKAALRSESLFLFFFNTSCNNLLSSWLTIESSC